MSMYNQPKSRLITFVDDLDRQNLCYIHADRETVWHAGGFHVGIFCLDDWCVWMIGVFGGSLLGLGGVLFFEFGKS